MTTCKLCNIPLVKQPIRNGKPLTQTEKDIKERYERAYNSSLECQVCGNPCYSRTITKMHIGICKRCGGNDLIHRPKDIEDFNQLEHIDCCMIWSCPIHGLL